MKVFYILFLLLSNSIIFSQEICDNGIDDDGDGQIDLNDSDCYCINPSLENNSKITSIPKSIWKAEMFLVFKKPFI